MQTPKQRREAVEQAVAALRNKQYKPAPRDDTITAEQIASLAPFLASRPEVARWIRRAGVIFGIYDGKLEPSGKLTGGSQDPGIPLSGLQREEADCILFARRMNLLLEEAAAYHREGRAFRLQVEPRYPEKEDGLQRSNS